MAESDKKEPITIKKYANRRLYNTSTSKYVTLDDLSQMVKAGDEFVVVDAKSGDDITRSVLTQIIFEEEAKGQNLLPVRFLRQLIQSAGGRGMFPMNQLEDMGRQNMAMFERAFQMFTPFGAASGGEPAEPKSSDAAGSGDKLDDLKIQIESLRAQLDALSR
jgi:polyhydroxyalkanoate synthesis repressor PhaR